MIWIRNAFNQIASLDSIAADGFVTFQARAGDRIGSRKETIHVRILGAEFVRRWCLHFFPKGYTKTRRFGGYSNHHRKCYIAECRQLLASAGRAIWCAHSASESQGGLGLVEAAARSPRLQPGVYDQHAFQAVERRQRECGLPLLSPFHGSDFHFTADPTLKRGATRCGLYEANTTCGSLAERAPHVALPALASGLLI